MSEIIKYTNEDIRTFIRVLENSYKKNQTRPLPFREWQSTAFNLFNTRPKDFNIDPPEPGSIIRVAPPVREMALTCDAHSKEFEHIKLNVPAEKQEGENTRLLRRIIKPVLEFETRPFFCNRDGEQIPMWMNTTTNGLNLRYGFKGGDSAAPFALTLDDDLVHSMLGGATGQGKTVTIHTVILNMMAEYPPWEVIMYLGDFKIVELCKYANRVPSSHCSMIAATESVEFIRSFYEELVREMELRKKLFTWAGVEKLANLRTKLNMCVPRGVVIIDEFVQQKVSVQKSEDAGNDKASDDLRYLQTKIGELARLGRSMGMHLFFSSQSLEGALDSGTEGQFSSGAALKAQKPVSTALIGNDLSAYLKGKGKILVNPNKSAKEASDNIMVRVPFMKVDLKEHEIERGDVLEMHELLAEYRRAAAEVGWEQTPYYYNESEIAPYAYFEGAKTYARKFFENPDFGDEISESIFKQTAAFTLPLGKPIKYNLTPSYLLQFQRIKRNNMIVSSPDKAALRYVVSILLEGFAMYPHDTVILAANQAMYKNTQLDKHPNAKVTTRNTLPAVVMNKFRARLTLMDIQGSITDATGNIWDATVAMTYCMGMYNTTRSPVTVPVSKLLEWATKVQESGTTTAVIEDDVKEEFPHEAVVVGNIINQYLQSYNALKGLTNFEKPLTSDMFKPLVCWFVGLDELESVTMGEDKRPFQEFLDKCCQLNIYAVVMAAVWSRAGMVAAPGCDIIVEAASAKDFFMDLGIPKTVNTNAKSFQVIRQEARERTVISMYTV